MHIKIWEKTMCDHSQLFELIGFIGWLGFMGFLFWVAHKK